MGNVIRPAFAGNRFDVTHARTAAHAKLKGTTLFVAYELATMTAANGEVVLTIEELQKLTRMSRGPMQAAIQKIVASGLIKRDPHFSWKFSWDNSLLFSGSNLQNSAKNSDPTGQQNAYSREQLLSHPGYVQGTWVEAYEAARNLPGVPIRLPVAKQWPIIETFGAVQRSRLNVPLELVAEHSCKGFFLRKGRVKEVGKHAMSWLPGELDADMMRFLDRALAPRTSSAPPTSGVGETPQSRARAAAGAMAAIARAS